MKKGKQKKQGFTLLEIGAVLGIIMLLIGFFVPRISGYLKDSKDVGIMAQAKTVVFAWETINTKENINLDKKTNKAVLKDKSGNKYEDYFDLNSTKNLKDTIDIETCIGIISGKPFTIDDQGFVDKFSSAIGSKND